MANIFGAIGKSLSNDKSAIKYLQKGSRNALEIGQKAESMIPRSGGVGRYASRLESAAVSLRQQQIGRRVVAGGIAGVGLSSVGSNKKSYYNPQPTAKGSGRYA